MSNHVPLLRRRGLLGGMALGTLAAGVVRPQPAAAQGSDDTDGPDATRPLRVFFIDKPDDGTSIQTALDAARDAGGGQVAVGPGTWRIAKRPLRIYSNTRLTLTPATVLLRSDSISALLSNGPRDGSDATTTGYNGASNIVVEGGVWDGNADKFHTAAWGMVFAHCRDITVRDLEIRNVPDWHAVELNSTYNGLVQNCRFHHYVNIAEPAWNAEAVSVDLAMDGLQPFGAGDNTESQLIRIIGNSCEDWNTFAGCHTAVDSSYHDQFVIAHNTMRNLVWWGVDLKNASHSIVIGNTMVNVGGGIWVRSDTTAGRIRPVTDVVISGNIIDTLTIDEAIRFAGTASDGVDGRIYHASVVGNVIRGPRLNGVLAQWCPDLHLADNEIGDSSGTGLNVQHSDRAVITGNHVAGTQTEGILVQSSADCMITGNSISNPALRGPRNAIQLNGVTRANVQVNKVTGKPTHAIAADAASAAILYTNNDARGGHQDTPFALAGTGHSDQPGYVA